MKLVILAERDINHVASKNEILHISFSRYCCDTIFHADQHQMKERRGVCYVKLSKICSLRNSVVIVNYWGEIYLFFFGGEGKLAHNLRAAATSSFAFPISCLSLWEPRSLCSPAQLNRRRTVSQGPW
jgi:hypothetical protein